MRLCCATFNVLADEYLGWGDYSHADPNLLLPRARLPYTLQLIANLQADVVGLQEVEPFLKEALEATNEWQLRWSPKESSEMPDGCLMLVRPGIEITDFETYAYSDGLGYIMQVVTIGGVPFVNTHIRFAPDDASPHFGVFQTEELLTRLGPDTTQPAVIFADCNGRPYGRVRALFEEAGFVNASGYEPTALIGEERAAIDLLAVRGLNATYIPTMESVEGIPSCACPSDHVPVRALVEIN